MPKAEQAASGIAWDRKRLPLLKDFLKGKDGRTAVKEAQDDFAVLKAAAHQYLPVDQADALERKLATDAALYCSDKAVKRVRQGDEERTKRSELFYGSSKPYLDMVAEQLKDARIDVGTKATALANLKDSLGKCEMGVQNAFATAFQDLGGCGGIHNLLQSRRQKAFDGLVEEFLANKDFCWRGHWTHPSDANCADAIRRSFRVGAEVHIAPALARALGADISLGIHAGVAAGDRFANDIGFHEADLSAMAAKLVDAVQLPRLISGVAREVAESLGDLMRTKLRGTEAFGAQPEDVFLQPVRDDQLEENWYEDFAQYAATTLGVRFVSGILSVDMQGAYTLSRNTGALQRQIVDVLAGDEGLDSIFVDELAIHEAARTHALMLERRGPIWVVRDRADDGDGYAEDFRCLRLKDLAVLSHAESPAWRAMPARNRALLLNWVMTENEPAFHEEALQILREPGAYREAMASCPREVQVILQAAMRRAFDKTWAQAAHAHGPGGNRASLDTMLAFYEQTDLSLPGAPSHPQQRANDPESVLIAQLVRAQDKEAIVRLLATGRLKMRDPHAFLARFCEGAAGRDWLRSLIASSPSSSSSIAETKAIDLRDGDDGWKPKEAGARARMAGDATSLPYGTPCSDEN